MTNIDKNALLIFPFEILLKKKNKKYFFQFWERFKFQIPYLQFLKLYSYIYGKLRSEDWYKDFFETPATKMYFEALTIDNQLDLIERMIVPLEVKGKQTTNDINIQDLDEWSPD